MKTATVTVNRICNQAFPFCTFRGAGDASMRPTPERIEARIREAASAGAGTLVLTGGEPTLDPHLESHLRLARDLGLGEMIVETNGMLLAYPGRALRLADAGATRVRVALNEIGQRSDRLTGVSGGFAYTMRGIENCFGASLQVELTTALTRANADRLPLIGRFVAERLSEARGLLLRVVTEPASWCVSYPRAAAALSETLGVAEDGRLKVRLDGRAAIPLCHLPPTIRTRALLEGSPGRLPGSADIAACRSCPGLEDCPGIPRSYLLVHDCSDVEPLSEPIHRRTDDREDGADAVERQLINDNRVVRPGMGARGYVTERVLRLVFRCNQRCRFCFVDRRLPAAPPERVLAEIERAAADGVEIFAFSGGEPTLDPDLPAYVREASSRGLEVHLQTNAIECDTPGYARSLAAAGLAGAFVSFHGGSVEVSDTVTGAPGTFVRTVAGVGALLEAGVPVTLNCVITGANYRHLPALVGFVSRTWGRSAPIFFSWTHASTSRVPLDDEVIPKVSDARPHLVAAVRACVESGVTWQGLDGQCGLPLCQVEAEWFDIDCLPDVPTPNPPPGFIKSESCAICPLSPKCIGLRETYARLHGTGELAPAS